MTIHDIALAPLAGGEPTLLSDLAGRTTLIVNVASRCGLTPQYEGLVALHERYAEQGFTVLGVPCNQFKGQEPGSAAEIQSFCAATYGVDFPLAEKVEVNGEDRHPLYRALTEAADAEGHAGDIRWNFEKFLVDGEGTVVARFAPLVDPLDDAITTAVEATLQG